MLCYSMLLLLVLLWYCSGSMVIAICFAGSLAAARPTRKVTPSFGSSIGLTIDIPRVSASRRTTHEHSWTTHHTYALAIVMRRHIHFHKKERIHQIRGTPHCYPCPLLRDQKMVTLASLCLLPIPSLAPTSSGPSGTELFIIIIVTRLLLLTIVIAKPAPQPTFCIHVFCIHVRSGLGLSWAVGGAPSASISARVV